MNSALKLFRKAQSFGLHIEVRTELVVTPQRPYPREFVGELKKNKAKLIDWLTRPICPGWYCVPPDDLPLSVDVPQSSPFDRDRMIAYLVNQGCARPGPLAAWLVRRESAYYDGPGRHWDCALHAYAAARDAACWQLNRSEHGVLELLTGIDCAMKGRI